MMASSSDEDYLDTKGIDKKVENSSKTVDTNLETTSCDENNIKGNENIDLNKVETVSLIKHEDVKVDVCDTEKQTMTVDNEHDSKKKTNEEKETNGLASLPGEGELSVTNTTLLKPINEVEIGRDYINDGSVVDPDSLNTETACGHLKESAFNNNEVEEVEIFKEHELKKTEFLANGCNGSEGKEFSNSKMKKKLNNVKGTISGTTKSQALSSLLAYGESSSDDETEHAVIETIVNWINPSTFTNPQLNPSAPCEESDTSSLSSSTSLFFSEDSDFDSDTEFFGITKKVKKRGPVTDGELTLDELPPIKELHISVPQDSCIHVGDIMNIVDKLVVIEGRKDRPALDLDTLLFLEFNKPLGHVFDVFGPVIEPMYCVRFNSAEHIKERNISVGMPVYFVPNPQFTSYVFLKQLMTTKGSDASWCDNNEPPHEHLDYSDDESERAAKNGHRVPKKEKVTDSDELQRKRPTAYEKRMNERNLKMNEIQRRRARFVQQHWKQDRLIRPPAFTPPPPPPPSANTGTRDNFVRPPSQFTFGNQTAFTDFRNCQMNDSSSSPVPSPDRLRFSSFSPFQPMSVQFPPSCFQPPPNFPVSPSVNLLQQFCNQKSNLPSPSNNMNQTSPGMFINSMPSHPSPSNMNMAGMGPLHNMNVPPPQTPPPFNMNVSIPPPPRPQTPAPSAQNRIMSTFQAASLQNMNMGAGLPRPQGQLPNYFASPQTATFLGDNNVPGPFPRPEFGPNRPNYQFQNHLTFHNPLHRPSTPTPPPYMFQ